MSFLKSAELPKTSGAYFFDGPQDAGGFNPNTGQYDPRVNAAGFKRFSWGRVAPLDGMRSLAIYTNFDDMADALVGERIEPQKLLQAQYQPVSAYQQRRMFDRQTELLHLKVTGWRGEREIGEAHGLYVENDGAFVLATAMLVTNDSIPGEMDHSQLAVYNYEKRVKNEGAHHLYQYDGVAIGAIENAAVVGMPYVGELGKIVHEIAVMPQRITFGEVEKTARGLVDSDFKPEDIVKTGHVIVYEHGRGSSPTIDAGKLGKAYRSFVRP